MPISIRVSPEKEKLIQKLAKRRKVTKTSIILSAVDEKLGLTKSREQTIRELAGWMPHEEAERLRNTVAVFNRVDERDWD